jgi:phage baseplate assembly protein W
MAYVLGSKLITDTEEYLTRGIGLSLPIKNSNTGYFGLNYLSKDQIKDNIRNLLRTKEGERLMHPTFGTGLKSILFSNITDDIETKITRTIENAFATWLPYITLDTIEVDISDEMKDRNKVGISIDYIIGDNIETDTVFFTIEG